MDDEVLHRFGVRQPRSVSRRNGLRHRVRESRHCHRLQLEVVAVRVVVDRQEIGRRDLFVCFVRERRIEHPSGLVRPCDSMSWGDIALPDGLRLQQRAPMLCLIVCNIVVDIVHRELERESHHPCLPDRGELPWSPLLRTQSEMEVHT